MSNEPSNFEILKNPEDLWNTDDIDNTDDVSSAGQTNRQRPQPTKGEEGIVGVNDQQGKHGLKTKGVHHIALACKDVDGQARFYASLGFVELRRQEDEEGLRSVWLDCSPSVLMLERCDSQEEKKTRPFHKKEAGVHLLAFTIDASEADRWRDLLVERELLADESDFTLYAYDSESNRIAFSSFPDQLRRRPVPPDSVLRPLPESRS